jgi:hypothetical protein
MSDPIDVFICGADGDAAAMTPLADAIRAAGMTCMAADGGAEINATLEALEHCRVLVFVLSGAASGTPTVVRDLERAAGRAIPIVTYALENVEPSPSIKFFTGTIPAIEAWSPAERERSTHALIDACRRGLQSRRPERDARPLRHQFSRARYVDSRNLFVGVAIALAVFAVLNAIALVRDAPLALATAAGWQPSVTAARVAEFMPTLAGPAGASWAILIGAMLMLRRARQNLAAQFAQRIQTGANEIVWRTFVPVANAFWLPRIADELWHAAQPVGQASPGLWPLARHWRTALLASYVCATVREFSYRLYTASGTPFAATSAMMEALSIVLIGVTYAVLAELNRLVRPRPLVERATAPAQTASTTASAATSMLLIYEADDRAVANRMAAILAQRGCQCWTCEDTPAAESFVTFGAVLVVVSPASHFSPRVLRVVQSALAARVSVLPFVLVRPPDGSPLGHYVRSLHWLDGSAGLAALRSIRFNEHAPAAVDERTFSRVDSETAISTESYRPLPVLRRIVRGLAITQTIAACLIGLIALAIAISPDSAGDPSGNLSILLLFASVPAWVAFLVWLSAAHRNRRVLFQSNRPGRFGLLLQVGLPGLSLALGGRALANFHPPASRLQIRWVVAGALVVVLAVAGWLLGHQGWIRAAMLLSIGQSIATASRGMMRSRFIRDVTLEHDRQARLWHVEAPAPPPIVEAGVR